MTRVDTMADGSARLYTSVGGYPLFYLTVCDDILCPRCALGDEGPMMGVAANWEDPHLHCDECSERIESAYAEDQAEGAA